MLKENAAYGAIAGDIIGSLYEGYNYKGKDFTLFTDHNRFTDDSVMTLALYNTLLETYPDFQNLSKEAVRNMQSFGRMYPHRGYGGHFRYWIHSDYPEPYNSWGNGAAMRVSGCGLIAKSLEQAIELSYKVTYVTHDHPEGIKGAAAISSAIFLAKTGHTINEIRQHIHDNYYQIDFTLDEIRPTYNFDVSCQGSVPQALEAFFESTDFEDAIRNAISIGGDSDTIGAMAGSIAGAYYGVPEYIKAEVKTILSPGLQEIIEKFYTLCNGGEVSENVYDIERFVKIQDSHYDSYEETQYELALSEIVRGRKVSHWMWYVFPQCDGLGYSAKSRIYSIKNIEEAKQYLQHPILGKRLREISEEVLRHHLFRREIKDIFGEIDAMKLKSSMTLFDIVQPNDVFARVLDAFYGGIRDDQTIELLQKK